MWFTCLMSVAGLLSSAESSGPFITNAGFESWTEVRPGSDGLVSGWRLGVPPQLAEGWTLNTAYPGQLLVGQAGPHSGQHFVRIVASVEQTPHLYQMCQGLKAGAWYRVSVWTRGGPIALYCYEYGKGKFLSTVSIAQTTGTSDAWRQVSGYYRPPTDEYERSALAISVPPGQAADIDDVAFTAVEIADAPSSAADVTWETDTLRLTISPSGMLREFRAKSTGEDYSAGRTPSGSCLWSAMACPHRCITLRVRATCCWLSFSTPK